MINMGTRKTRVGRDGWLVTTRDHKPSAHFEKTVAITEDGPLILTTEPGFTRPVSKNLLNARSVKQVLLAIKPGGIVTLSGFCR